MPAMTKAQLADENATLRSALEAMRLQLAEMQEWRKALAAAPAIQLTDATAPTPQAPRYVATETKNAQPWTGAALRAMLRRLRPLNAERRAAYLAKCCNRPLAQRRALYRHFQKVDARSQHAIRA